MSSSSSSFLHTHEARPPSTSQLGEEVYRLCDELVDDVVRVSDDEISAAIRDCFDDTRALLEPAGAISIAGLKRWHEKQQTALQQQQQQQQQQQRTIGHDDAAGHAAAAAAAPRPQYVAIASDACNIEFEFLQQVASGSGDRRSSIVRVRSNAGDRKDL